MTKVEFTKKETAEAMAIARRHPDFEGITTPVLHDIFMKAVRAYDIAYNQDIKEVDAK